MRKLLLAFLLLAPLAVQAQVPVALMPIPHAQFLDANAHPLAGGKVCFFNAGTTTPAATYVDVNGVILNSNPVVLDSGGFATIYLASQEYKVIVYDGSGNSSCPNTGVQQWSQDSVNAFQILVAAQSIILAPTTVDPAGTNGQLGFRSDIPCIRFFITVWDCFVGNNLAATLTNKTIDSAAFTGTQTGFIAASPTLNNPIINGTLVPGPPATYLTMTNDTVTGTTLNKLAKINPAGLAGLAIVTSAGDTGGAVGVVVAGAGTSLNATIQQSGSAQCVFDNAVVAGDYAQISSSVAGDCHDAGVNYPSSGGQIIGRLLATNIAAGTYFVDLFSPEIKSLTQVSLAAAGYSNATTTFSDVTGLSFSVAANANYTATCNIYFQGSATTAGPKFQFTGPAAPTAVQISVDGANASTAVDNFVSAFSTANVTMGTLAAAGRNFIARVTISLRNGANGGAVQLQAAANGAGTLTLFSPSMCTLNAQ